MAKVNFSRLGADAAKTARKLTEPRDLFSALPDKVAELDYLRGPQDQVLSEWHGRRNDRDLVIKMNTGGGKTIVGLLIARSWLNEGIKPVAYLVPDKFLKAQALKEAERLGVQTTTEPRSPEYSRGQAVLVDVFTRLFNGQSVFGVSGSVSKTPSCALGGVIIDDAHACLSLAEDIFRLRLNQGTTEYTQLLDLFRPDLNQQSPNGLLDLDAKRSSAILQIPHWAWWDKQEQVLQILHPAASRDDLKWAWPLIVDALPLCVAVITADGIEIQPPRHPVDTLVGFSSAERRLYLTATLADDSVLIRDFGAAQETIERPIVPASAGDIGDRLILLPQQLVPGLSDELARDFVASLAVDRNVVVIVPSHVRASWWLDHAALILDKNNIDDGIQQLRDDSNLGLVVLINRYDGIDLPGDSCHVLVLDGLPEALDGIERLEQAHLTGSSSLLGRQVQRLEQGMGRATRSNEDHSVVLLLGARLSERLNAQGAREMFSPATRAQLDLADEVAAEIEIDKVDDLREVIDQCLNRERAWIAYSRGALAEVRYAVPTISPGAAFERRGYDAASRQDFDEAIRSAQEAVNVTTDQMQQSLMRQQLSAYTHPVNASDAQQIQKSANTANRNLLRPMTGVAYTRLKSRNTTQGEEACAYLMNRYPLANDLIIGINALLNDLGWGPRTRAFEQAICDLAWHIGFAGERPEQATGRGPDDLWALADGSYLVIEAKSGAKDTHPVYKDDAKQLSNAMDWFRAEYKKAVGTPVLVHPQANFDRHAAVPTGCRVITTRKLDELRDSVRGLSVALAHQDAYKDASEVTTLLQSSGLTGEEFLKRFTVAGRH